MTPPDRQRPGFLARLMNRQPAPPSAAKSLSLVNTANVGYSFAVGGYVPHEPFTQAWQKNMEGKSYRDPVMLAFSGVYACITIISQDLAKMPLRVVNIDPKDNVTRTVAFNNPYHRLLRRPNDYQSSVDFAQMWSISKLVTGNAYGFKMLDGRGVPTAIHILNPQRVKVLVNSTTKEVYYEYTPYNQDMGLFNDLGEGGTVVIPARFILHDRINCLWHPLIGIAPLFAAAVSAATGGRILMNSEKLFGNMARPSGILTSAGEISDVTATRLKREFEANYSAGNIGRTAVLGDGLDWKSMVMTGVDAQLIEQLKWTIEDVARVYRVPMYLLADVTRMTYKNSEQAAQSYFSGCLQFHVESTEARFNLDFGMVEGQQEVDCDVSVLFRMDTRERFAAYKEGIGGGVLSPNEARAKEGLGPVKGGEEPRMQIQYVPLSTPAAAPAPVGGAPAPAAPSPAAEEPDEEQPPPDEEDDDDEEKQIKIEQALASHQEMLDIVNKMGRASGRVRNLRKGMQ